jgi:hypothetical protein
MSATLTTVALATESAVPANPAAVVTSLLGLLFVVAWLSLLYR